MAAARPNLALSLKQQANWRCSSCNRPCRRAQETPADLARRLGLDPETVAAHPRRWTLHLSPGRPPRVLCGGCHRSYHNRLRQQRRRQRQRQQWEAQGQMTLADIRNPLAGTQLALEDWGAPYTIVNPPRRRRS